MLVYLLRAPISMPATILNGYSAGLSVCLEWKCMMFWSLLCSVLSSFYKKQHVRHDLNQTYINPCSYFISFSQNLSAIFSDSALQPFWALEAFIAHVTSCNTAWHCICQLDQAIAAGIYAALGWQSDGKSLADGAMWQLHVLTDVGEEWVECLVFKLRHGSGEWT